CACCAEDRTGFASWWCVPVLAGRGRGGRRPPPDSTGRGERALTPTEAVGSGRLLLGLRGLRSGGLRSRLTGGQLLGGLLHRRGGLLRRLVLHLVDLALEDAQRASEATGRVGQSLRTEEHHEQQRDDQQVRPAERA